MAGQQRYVLGIDGGGTHTRAALLDDEGNLLGTGEGGPSNYQSAGIDETRRNIGRAADAAYAGAGVPRSPARAVFLGMAGVVSPADRATIEMMARELDLAERIGVDHDIRTALAGGLATEEGIALIAGTGSSCYGRRGDGRSWRAGGWGHLLDDVGSAYWIGLQGLIAITRAADGRAGATILSRLLIEALRLNDIEEIIRLAGHEGLSRERIAALAPLVLRAWTEGDTAASAIVRRGADELALMARSVAAQLGWQDAPVGVVTIGGVFGDAGYRELVVAAIAALLPNAGVVEPALPPSLGAGLLALELAGSSPGGAVIGRLRESFASRLRNDRSTNHIIQERRS